MLYQSTWKNFVIWNKSGVLIRWYNNTRIFLVTVELVLIYIACKEYVLNISWTNDSNTISGIIKVWLANVVFYSVVVLHCDVYYMTLWIQHLTNLHNTAVPCIQTHIPHTYCLWRHNYSFQDTARNNSLRNVQVWDNLISIQMILNMTCFVYSS